MCFDLKVDVSQFSQSHSNRLLCVDEHNILFSQLGLKILYNSMQNNSYYCIIQR